jgi:hypothetical protein
MRETSAPTVLHSSGGNAAPAGPRPVRALDAQGPEVPLAGDHALAQARKAGERRLSGAGHGAKLARSWLCVRRRPPCGHPGALADPKGALDERVVRIGRRVRGRPGCALHGSLGSAALLAGCGNADRNLRGKGALLRPCQQAAEVREGRAADPLARHPAGELVEQLLRQLAWQAGELPLRGRGFGPREPCRVLECSGIVRAIAGRIAPATGIALTAVTIIPITIVITTTVANARVDVRVGLRHSAGTLAGGSEEGQPGRTGRSAALQLCWVGSSDRSTRRCRRRRAATTTS